MVVFSPFSTLVYRREGYEEHGASRVLGSVCSIDSKELVCAIDLNTAE